MIVVSQHVKDPAALPSKIAGCSPVLSGDPRWFLKWDRIVPRLGLRFAAVREVRSIVVASSDRRSKGVPLTAHADNESCRAITNSNPSGGIDFESASAQTSSTNGQIANSVFESERAVLIAVL